MSRLIQTGLFIGLISFSSIALAEYYLVEAAPVQCIYGCGYPTKVVKHKQYKKSACGKTKKKHVAYKKPTYKKRSTARVEVYYVCNANPCWTYPTCGPCAAPAPSSRSSRSYVVYSAQPYAYNPYTYNHKEEVIYYDPDMATADDNAWYDPEMNIDR